MANEPNIGLGKRRGLNANIGAPGYLGKGDPGVGIARIDFIGNDKDGGNVYRVYLTDDTYYDITAPKGAPGSGGSGGGSNEVWLPAVSDGVLTWTKSSSDIPPAPANIKGDTGAAGAPGKDGKTPVKGTDYWTAADKQEMIDDIHPAYYIDLEGEYPNYTCPMAMADIKAAYEADKVLECRFAIGQYTATLPLFIPMPSANTWIFSGAGALAAMRFHAQAVTIAIVNGAVQASNTRLVSMADIPTIPDALPNPNALTIKIGSTTVTYDGSSAQTVEIADGTEVSY